VTETRKALDLYNITFLPQGEKIAVAGKQTLKDAILETGIAFDFPCGGTGTCGKCRVRIIDKPLPPTPQEKKLLGKKEISQGVRLACATEIRADLTVQLEPPKRNTHRILHTSAQTGFHLEPLLAKKYVEVPTPSLADPKAYWNRLKDALGKKDRNFINLKVSLPILRDLPDLMRLAEYKLTAITKGEEIIGIEKFDTTCTLLGAAFDIGTTTVVGYLMDLYRGKELAVASSLNPQVNFGADVISRIAAAGKSAKDLKSLQRAIVNHVDLLVGELVKKAGVKREDVYALTVAGNTCMHHLFLGLDPKHLGVAPYVPVTNDLVISEARDFNININPAGRVFAFPNIAGYVGGDTVAVVLATGMDKSRAIKLALDIGTNGEIVLGNKERLIACSAAAGPAFEGAHISSGMRGAEGAIDSVSFGENLVYTVIGETKPQGLCGSGLLDVAAGLIELGIINKRGKLLSPEEVSNPQAAPFLGNIVKLAGTNAFLLAPETITAHGRPVMVTQADIASLQLAKSAIATAVQALIETYGIEIDDIREVLIAGAFGNYMAPHSACVVGLIPRELEQRIKMVGNAAGTGAKAALLSRRELERTKYISSRVEYVELASYEGFSNMFIQALRFHG